jgi:glycerol-3-phosphate dehydrogenase
VTRRLHVSIETPDRGLRAAESVGPLVGEALGWDAATAEREVERYRLRVEAELASQEQADDVSADAVRQSARDPRLARGDGTQPDGAPARRHPISTRE